MKPFYTNQFKKKFHHLSKKVKQKFEKQLGYLLENVRHPSLHAKKYDEENDI